VLGLLDEHFEPRPRIEGDLDGVLGSVPFQERDDLAAEKRAVHAKFQPVIGAEGGSDLREQRTQESERCLPIVHVPWAVLNSQYLSALSLVGGDRVVARHLASVRVEAPLSPLDPKPGRHDRAIHVDGQPSGATVANGAGRN
jgi:hypothetical protein